MGFIKYQLYLLQIENYEIVRFFQLLFKKGYFKSKTQLRKSLVWTKKILLVLLLSLIIIVLLTYIAMSLATWLAVLWIILSILLLPFYFAISVLLLKPFDTIVKEIIISRARSTLADRKGKLKIIGIAGSYGKTTLKNVLYQVLSQKYKVLVASGNINTAVGLSSWILKQDLTGADVLLTEFGEEYPGDNKRIASIFDLDICIITGINEAHFERMGSIEKSAETIFEAIQFMPTDSSVFFNADDDNVKKYQKTYTAGKRAIEYSSNRCEGLMITGKRFNQDSLSWSADISSIGEVKVSFLAEYIFSDVAVASQIALDQGLSRDDIKRGFSEISPVEHRLQPIINKTSGVLVIDDSYNGNPTGVAEAIKTLALFKDRRRIYLTPGLVETGQRNREVHEEIGAQLSDVADIVILVKNSATPHIAEGLLSAGFSKENIIWYDTALQAHADLGNILKSGDVILFQNDWGDQYL